MIKKQPTEWEKILPSYVADKALVPRIKNKSTIERNF